MGWRVTENMPAASTLALHWLGGRAELQAVDVDTAPAGGDDAWLSDEERARAARFVFERDRRLYVNAHVRLRQALSARTGRLPHTLAYEIGPHGKPSLSGGGCAFNMSHSGPLAWIVMADDGDIGVDVEARRPMADADDLAARLYTADERATIARAGRHGRDLAFLTCWTRKEACLKALGVGLLVEPGTFEAGASMDAAVARIATPRGEFDVEVRSLVLDESSIGAVARVCPPHTGRLVSA